MIYIYIYIYHFIISSNPPHLLDGLSGHGSGGVHCNEPEGSSNSTCSAERVRLTMTLTFYVATIWQIWQNLDTFWQIWLLKLLLTLKFFFMPLRLWIGASGSVWRKKLGPQRQGVIRRAECCFFLSGPIITSINNHEFRIHINLSVTFLPWQMSAKVILATGVLATPKLLTLSGIAEPKELERLDIPAELSCLSCASWCWVVQEKT